MIFSCDAKQQFKNRLSQNAVVQLAAKLLYMLSRVGLPPIILGYVSLIILGYVSLEEYGIWATCFIVISYLGMSTFGIANVYIRYTAEYHARHDTEAINRLLTTVQPPADYRPGRHPSALPGSAGAAGLGDAATAGRFQGRPTPARNCCHPDFRHRHRDDARPDVRRIWPCAGWFATDGAANRHLGGELPAGDHADRRPAAGWAGGVCAAVGFRHPLFAGDLAKRPRLLPGSARPESWPAPLRPEPAIAFLPLRRRGADFRPAEHDPLFHREGYRRGVHRRARHGPVRSGREVAGHVQPDHLGAEHGPRR